MTLLYTDPIFLEHETGRHPERRQRLEQIQAQLRRTGLDEQCLRPAVGEISRERLLYLHDGAYLERLDRYAASGGGRIEEDTIVSPRSPEVARYAAGAVVDAVVRVVRGEERRALCLVRPPGHHALREAAMGFCLFSNVALGAAVATRELGVDRVLVVDWDVHHGNGTQDAVWQDPQVGFFSIHRWPFYPGTGWKDETGEGPGLGTVWNLPVEFGTARREYLAAFARELEAAAARMRPELVLVSAGFDAHAADPVGSLGLEIEDFEPLTEAVLDVADTYAGGRLVSVLEGGYNPGILAGCVETHLKRMLARDAHEKAT